MVAAPSVRRTSPTAPRVPAGPRLPASLEIATTPEHDLVAEVTYRRIRFSGTDFSGREAESVEFEQCRFTRASLAQTVLDRVTFTDCLIENSDWANLKATRSRLRRVSLSAVRLTGLHWIDGVVRDVNLTGCRMDLAALRFTSFKDVAFVDCNVTRADFTNANLRGAQFTDCDLSGAQFAQADCTGARFTRCELSGIGSVERLRGATVSATDLVGLSYALAGALGITIEE